MWSQAEAQTGTLHLRLRPDQHVGFHSLVYANPPNKGAQHVYELEMKQYGVSVQWLQSHSELFADNALHSLGAGELCTGPSGILRPFNCTDSPPTLENISNQCQASETCAPRLVDVRKEYENLSWQQRLWLRLKVGDL